MSRKKEIAKNKILNLLVGRDDGVVQSYFGIKHEGKLWLVPEWLIDHATGTATPVRMIRVDKFQKGDGSPFDYANILLPKAVIEDVSQDTPEFEVRSLPDSPVVDAGDLKMLPQIFG